MARVNYRKVCLWVTRDPVFKAELAAAKVEQEDFLREVLHERAVTGREKPVIYRGEVVYLRDPVTGDFILNDDFEPQMLTENQVSDKLLERMLDARLPEYAKAKGDGTGGRVDAVVNVRFVAPPQDWETVEWDEEGRPKGARVIDAEAKEVDAEASDREADTGEVPEPVQAG